MSRSGRRPFFSTCVEWPRERLRVLEHLQDEAEEIPIARFARLVDADDWRACRRRLGYVVGRGPGLRIEDDWHVRFHLHRASGIPFLVHSATEIVFARDAEIAALDRDLHEAELRAMVDDDPVPEP